MEFNVTIKSTLMSWTKQKFKNKRFAMQSVTLLLNRKIKDVHFMCNNADKDFF